MVTHRDDVIDVPVEEMADILRLAYGLVADELDVASGEIATVYRVQAGGRSFAVKALPGSALDGRLVRWQTQAMETLRLHGLPVPAVMPTVHGELVHESPLGRRDVYPVVVDWVSDPPLAEVAVDDALLGTVGDLAGRVSVALAQVPAPPVPAHHEWELVRTADSIRTVLPRVRDKRVAALATEVASIHDRAIRPLLPRLPRSVVHHDLHDANIVIGTSPAGARTVTGILDFGDMVEGPRIAELVVAAAYAARNTGAPATAVSLVAASWHRVQPLTPEERTVLLPGVQSRLALNSAVWSARSTGLRGTYAAQRSSGALDTLEKMLQVTPLDFLEQLRNRCSVSPDG